MWNMGGVEPEGCAELQEVAVVADPNARVWRGAGDAQEQGVRVLGVPVGHPSYVRVQLSEIQHDQPNIVGSRFFSKTGDKDMNGPVLRESEMLVLGEMPC